MIFQCSLPQYRNPDPPIYVGATVDKAIQRAARLGDEFLISATQRKSDIPRILDVYKAELNDHLEKISARKPRLLTGSCMLLKTQ